MCRHVAVILVLLSTCQAGPAVQAGTDPFVVDTLLDGVWLFRAPGSPGSHTNSLVIERDSGLLVVEAQPSPESASQLIRAIGSVSKKPIQYLVLSRSSVESTGGAAAFPETALVISSAVTHEVLADESRDIAGAARLRAPDPAAWVAPPRVLPELLLSSAVELLDGKHRIRLMPILRGHHAGFVMLSLEEEEFYYVGTMISAERNPYADMEHSDMRAWVNSLNNLSMLRPRWIVPSSGEPIRTDQLRRFRDSLAWVIGQVENAFIERVEVDQVVSFAMDSPKLGEYFDLGAEPSFVNSLFEKALEESSQTARKRAGGGP